MSDDAFQRVFGEPPRRPASFAQRLGREEKERPEPPAAMVAEAAAAALAGDAYRAFGFMPNGQAPLSCELRWWLDGTAIPEGLAFPYRLLMEVGFTGDDTLRLLLPNKAIEIVGERLEPLRQALMRQQVTFVQQWSSCIWHTRPRNASVIEGFEVRN